MQEAKTSFVQREQLASENRRVIIANWKVHNCTRLHLQLGAHGIKTVSFCYVLKNQFNLS